MTQNIETTAIIQPWARAAYPNRSIQVNSAFCCLWDGEMSIFPAKQGRRTGGGGMVPSFSYKEEPSVILPPPAQSEDENCCTAYNMDKKKRNHSKNVAQK